MKKEKTGLIFLLFWTFIALHVSTIQAAGIKFGYTPYLNEAEMRNDLKPLMDYLTESIGSEVILYIAKDYGDLKAQMELGKVDIGTFSPFAYVDAEKGGKVKIIAQSTTDHSAFYKGLIIAKKGSGMTDLKDLKGKRFAFVDPKSASGYVYPKAMLIEKGIDPDQFFKETIFAGNHDKVIESVLEGKVDAGATYENALVSAKGKGVKTENLVTLASTDPIPISAIAVRSDLDASTIQKIQKVLIDLGNTDEGKKVIAQSKRKFTGFILADDKVYDVVRRAAKVSEMK